MTMSEAGMTMKWSGCAAYVRRGVAWMLAVVALLAASASGAWASEPKVQREASGSVDLHEGKKTAVDGVTSYGLGNATVTGANASYFAVEVGGGWFTVGQRPSGPLESFTALDVDGRIVSGANAAAGTKYKYLAVDSGGRDNRSLKASDIQVLLRGLRFYLGGGKKQSVSVTVSGNMPRATYNGKEYDVVLYGEKAYAFIDQQTGHDTLETEARKALFLGRNGRLMSVGSYNEHMLAHVLLGRDGSSAGAAVPGVIGGGLVGLDGHAVPSPTQSTESRGNQETTPKVDGFYVEFDGFDPSKAGQSTVTVTVLSVSSELRDAASSNPAANVLSGVPYETTLTASGDRGLDLATLKVSVSGKTLDGKTGGFSLDDNNGRLHIPATSMTGDVVISASGNRLVAVKNTGSDKPLTTVRVGNGQRLDENELNRKVGTMDGYTLSGYRRGDKKWDFSDPVTEDMTLHPHWVLTAQKAEVTPSGPHVDGKPAGVKRGDALSATGLAVAIPIVAVALLLIVAGALVVLRARRGK